MLHLYTGEWLDDIDAIPPGLRIVKHVPDNPPPDYDPDDWDWFYVLDEQGEQVALHALLESLAPANYEAEEEEDYHLTSADHAIGCIVITGVFGWLFGAPPTIIIACVAAFAVVAVTFIISGAIATRRTT